ncbi:hypothetical protein AYO44_04285 [Planctomycetaceae bacterium SCGC AG-212-F19]|nr:hypothetical protein AYO44_04285 [Planctomycetaceae bacterium SCGC AG-212-F19]
MPPHNDRNFVPRNGHTLVVAIVARISGCQNQKELSLEDQEDHGKEVVSERYQGPVDYRAIATKGKGEQLDRPELVEIEAMLRSRELDLLICEDIGRLTRSVEAVTLCGIAVDHGTRVIAPNDCVDTADDNWENDVIEACKEHVRHNAHASMRIKYKSMNRFIKKGRPNHAPFLATSGPRTTTTGERMNPQFGSTTNGNGSFARPGTARPSPTF